MYERLIFKNRNFIKTVCRPYAPFYSSLYFDGFKNPSNWEPYVGKPYAIRDLLIIDGHWCFTEAHIKNFADELGCLLIGDSRKFAQLKQVTLQQEEYLLASADDSIEEFVSAFEQYIPSIGIYFILDTFLENQITSKFLEVCDKNEAQLLIEDISLPLEDNIHIQEKLDVLSMSDEDFLVKYAWRQSRFGNIQHYEPAEVHQLRQDTLDDNFYEAYLHQKECTKNSIEKAKHKLGKNAFWVDLLQFFVYYRTHRTDVVNLAIHRFASQLETLAHTKNLKYEQALFCTYGELREQVPSLDVLRQRREAHSCIGIDGKLVVSTSKEHSQLVNLLHPSLKEYQQLSGSVAFPGNVIGTVRIIKEMKDISCITESDILVAAMTTPNMLAGIIKCKGIVTDEGGITCHASILAREMKKVCVIGTKYATRWLQNGERVQINGQTGKVTKLASQ
jgi:phosphohistidine swiveling domain-containing protein